MPFRWPTDPPGKAPSHTKSWDAHQTSLKGGAPAATLPSIANPLPLIQPPDATYQADTGDATAARDQALAAASGSRTAGLLDYGYNEDATSGALTFDPNNPFSKAAQLKKNFDTSRRSTGQTMGAGGQLYAGAFQNSQDLINRGQVQGEDALQKSLSAFLLNNTNDTARAGTGYDAAMQRAEANRMGRTMDNPLYFPDVTAADAAAVVPPAQGVGSSATSTNKGKKPLTLKAGAGVKSTKHSTSKTTKKGNTVTYSTSIKGP